MTNAATTSISPLRLWSAWWDSLRAQRDLAQPVAARPTALQATLWLLATALSAGLILFNFDSFQLGAFDDDAHYVVLARSIVETGRLGAINLPGEPGQPQFPLGFPLLLAPLVLAFPNNVEALKFVSLVATLLNIGIIFWGWPWLSRSTSRWWGVAVMGCYSLSPLVVNHARMVMSEAVFTTVCLVACLVVERLSRGGISTKWIGLLGLTLLALCVIRSVGLVFAAGLFASLGIAFGRRAVKPILGALAAAAFAATLLVLPTSLQAGDILSPVQRYTGDVLNFTQNQDDYARTQPVTYPFLIRAVRLAYYHAGNELRTTVFALGGGERERAFLAGFGLPFLQDVIGLVIGGLVIAGILRVFWREGGSAFPTVAIVYLGSLFFWRWIGERFLYPVLPQLLLGLFQGVEGLVRLAPAGRTAGAQRWAVLAAVIVVASAYMYRTIQIDPSIHHTGDLRLRTEWIGANTEPDAVILSELPATDFIYGQRHTVDLIRLPEESPDDTLLTYLGANEVDYILVAPQLTWQAQYAPLYSANMVTLIEAVECLAAQGRVTGVYASPEDTIRVYRVAP